MLDDFPTLRAQRDAFAEAARRETSAARPRSRSRVRRMVAVAMVGVLGAAGVAVGTDLIAIGQPEQDGIQQRGDFGPATQYDIVVTAPDEPLPWGVGVFVADNGLPCAIAGQLRGSSLGVVRDGTFRPFEESTGGPCRKSPRRAVVSERPIGSRNLVFGLAPQRARTVEFVEATGATRTAIAGRDGAFLFVYDVGTSLGDFTAVNYRDAAGRNLR